MFYCQNINIKKCIYFHLLIPLDIGRKTKAKSMKLTIYFTMLKSMQFISVNMVLIYYINTIALSSEI